MIKKKTQIVPQEKSTNASNLYIKDAQNKPKKKYQNFTDVGLFAYHLNKI